MSQFPDSPICHSALPLSNRPAISRFCVFDMPRTRRAVSKGLESNGFFPRTSHQAFVMGGG